MMLEVYGAGAENEGKSNKEKRQVVVLYVVATVFDSFLMEQQESRKQIENKTYCDFIRIVAFDL